tara:strand:+ start:84 stop:479 length:396 start_codon:yes stop_codon:yes gene_type:complete
MDDHRLHRMVIRVIAQPTTVHPFRSAGVPKHPRFVFRPVGISNAALQLTVEYNQTGNERIGRPWCAAVFPLPQVTVINPEVHMPGIGHRTISGRAAGQMQVETSACNGVELIHQIAQRVAQRHFAIHPQSD